MLSFSPYTIRSRSHSGCRAVHMLKVSPGEGAGVAVSISCLVIEWNVGEITSRISPALISFILVLLLLLFSQVHVGNSIFHFRYIE